MTIKQAISVILFSGIHFATVAFCNFCNAGAKDDPDAWPILTIILLPQALAAGIVIIVASIMKFLISNKRVQLAILLLTVTIVCNLVHYSEWGGPFIWFGLFPIVAIQYICCLIVLFTIGNIYEKLG